MKNKTETSGNDVEKIQQRAGSKYRDQRSKKKFAISETESEVEISRPKQNRAKAVWIASDSDYVPTDAPKEKSSRLKAKRKVSPVIREAARGIF